MPSSLKWYCCAGRWGLFINAVNTTWQKADSFVLTCIACPEVTILVKWVDMMQQGSSFGVRKSFDWLERRAMLLGQGRVLGIRLERLQASHAIRGY